MKNTGDEFKVMRVDRSDNTVLLKNLAMRGRLANVWATTDNTLCTGMVVRGTFDFDPKHSLVMCRFPKFTVS